MAIYDHQAFSRGISGENIKEFIVDEIAPYNRVICRDIFNMQGKTNIENVQKYTIQEDQDGPYIDLTDN